MNSAADYLAHVKALIVLNPKVLHWTVLREEAQEEMGLFRYRLILGDGSQLEMFERFQIVAEGAMVTKYSFHWQDAGGRLLKRWDNAAHHPEVATHPHHLHDGAEANTLPYEPMNAEKVLAFATEEIAG